MPVVSINQRFIETGLQCPSGRKIEYTDRSLPGFFVEVTASSPGVGSYRLRYRSGGRTRYETLGRTDVVPLEDARQAAKAAKARVQLGQDLSSRSSKLPATPSLDQFVANEYTAAIKTRKRTWQKDLERYRNHIQPSLGGQRLQDIKKPQIQALHTSVREKGLSGASADHVLKVIRQIFSLAIDYEYVEKNPATGVRQYNVDNRVERYLDDQELRRLRIPLKPATNST